MHEIQAIHVTKYIPVTTKLCFGDFEDYFAPGMEGSVNEDSLFLREFCHNMYAIFTDIGT